MNVKTIYHTWQRYKTLQTHKITALPVVVLMPHSACNCRCVMCDIWKDNKNLKQLSEKDITGLLDSLKKLGTKQVAMSGGEALLNINFFKLCELLKEQHIKISLLSTGLSIRKYANELLHYVDELIVSLDGDEALHDAIRNIPQAFSKLKDGVQHIKSMRPSYRITGRTVIHRLNFHKWRAIINEAHEMGLDQISFLPADVTSHAFNRQTAWNEPKQHEILPAKTDLPVLKQVINNLLNDCEDDLRTGFIAEPPSKIQDIYNYYAAF